MQYSTQTIYLLYIFLSKYTRNIHNKQHTNTVIHSINAQYAFIDLKASERRGGEGEREGKNTCVNIRFDAKSKQIKNDGKLWNSNIDHSAQRICRKLKRHKTTITQHK